MEHANALERIEIAATEPDGLERLMAGDTPEAAEVAGHLAGCPACVDELTRIRRTTTIVRDVILAQPDPALRERTLAFVRAVGRDRSGAERAHAGATVAATRDPATDGAADAPADRPQLTVVADPAGAARRDTGSPSLSSPGVPMRAGRWRMPVPWAAGIAAALIVAGALGFGAGAVLRSPASDDRRTEVAVLQGATTAAVRVAAQPDARHVELAPTSGGSATGSLVFSPSSGELVMIATNLAPEPAGQQYGCWVEQDGQRRRLGRMYWAGKLWAWAGPATGLASLPPGTVFGVSLGASGGGEGEPVLTGQL